MSKAAKKLVFDEEELRKELLQSARAVGVVGAAAELIAARVTESVAARVERRTVVTVNDLNKFIADEAKKYNKDLAYVYRNRGKII